MRVQLYVCEEKCLRSEIYFKADLSPKLQANDVILVLLIIMQQTNVIDCSNHAAIGLILLITIIMQLL